ncbi:MAG: hypothetical protein K1X54_13800, partial [Flavobacteriales bacterium]|nr:hypothetical protein [Flavobacteriales bacterium]
MTSKISIQLPFRKKKSGYRWVTIFTFLFFALHMMHAQNPDSMHVMQKRKWILGGSTMLAAGTSYYLLNDLWYKNYERTTLHFFNDNQEWLQMDKVGHSFTTYTTGRYMCDAM